MSEKKPLHIPSTAGQLPKHWHWERLDEVCSGTFDCPHSTPLLTTEGPFVVRSQDVRSGIFRMEEAARVSDETYQERIARAEPRHGDLVYSREGTYFGIAAELPPGVRVCLGQRMVLLRPNEHKANFRLLRYWLNSPVMARHIHGHRDGTVAERLNMPTIRALPIALPSLSEQRAIASVLGALDDKIELNRRMNETLEALARALFQNWFVDATQAGLPKDWREVPLPEAIEVNPSRPLRKGEVAPYLDMANMPTGAPRAMEVYDREFGSGMRFMDGDTLVARITPCLENGKTCFVDFLGVGKIGWGSTEYIVLRPKPPLPPEYAYFLARTENFRAFAISNMTGTSGRQRVPADCLNNFTIALPPPELAERFGEFARSVFAQMKAHDDESRTLAAMRDALLPKLLSGELRVPAAAQLVEAHA